MKKSESSTSSAESAGSPSASSGPADSVPSGTARSTRSAKVFYSEEWSGGTWILPQSVPTCAAWMESLGEAGPMRSLGGSLAQTSATLAQTPVSDLGSTAPEAAFGERCSGWFARFDQESSLWKTLQLSLFGGWSEFSGTWPRSGTIASGNAYQREPLAPPISEIESTWLPTIGFNEFKGAGKARFLGSPSFRGAKMSEGLRTCKEDPIYLHPSFAELAMGYPIGWTVLEDAETQSSQASRNGSVAS